MDILIIEDDDLVASSLRLLLENQGLHTIRVVAGSEDAIATARAFPPDLVIADLSLTIDRRDHDGLSVLAAIRGFATPACIIMSGNPLPEEVARNMEPHFLRKPFRVADLLRLIEAAAGELSQSSGRIPT